MMESSGCELVPCHVEYLMLTNGSICVPKIAEGSFGDRILTQFDCDLQTITSSQYLFLLVRGTNQYYILVSDRP